ncbi:unnamed protein product [Caenorhabditis brenneri]
MATQSVYTLLIILIQLLCLKEAAIFETYHTDIHISGWVECPIEIHKPWCFNVWFQEVDPIKNDLVGYFGTKCITSSRRDFEIKGKQAGDGIGDYFYEFRIVIRHNCTTNGGYRRLHMDFVEPVNSTKVHRLNLNLTALSTANTSTRVNDLNEMQI